MIPRPEANPAEEYMKVEMTGDKPPEVAAVIRFEIKEASIVQVSGTYMLWDPYDKFNVNELRVINRKLREMNDCREDEIKNKFASRANGQSYVRKGKG